MRCAMRRIAVGLLVLGLHLLFIQAIRADDDAAKVIEKAVKAHFPKGLDTKHTAVRTKSKGTLHVQGLDLEFTNEVSVQAPKFKEAVEMEVMGNKVSVVSVFNGKEAWIRAGGMEVPVNEDILNEFKDAAYIMEIMQGVFGKDKTLKFSLVGEAKIKDKPAVGVKISREGKKDITVYFDKDTGLMAKIEMRKKDIMGGQEVNEERFIVEYQDLNGRKVAKKIEIKRDDKPYLEAEVTSSEVLEKIDDSEFAKPQ
jgi:hypothetical protein